MANPSWLNKYLTMKPEVNKIFDDLEGLLDYCRFEMLPYNEADLYNKQSVIWQQYEYSKKPRRPYKGRNDNRNRSNNNFNRART